MKRTPVDLAPIVKALRERGASVASLSDRGTGWPRLLVGFMGCNLLFEACEPGDLTEAQRDWHSSWHGQVHVVESAARAVEFIDELERVSRMPGGPKYVEGDFEPPKPWSPE